MAIEEQRRAKLAALVTALSIEQVKLLKAQVQGACEHSYNEVQHHAWGMCDCDAEACPEWVDKGFSAAEVFCSSAAAQRLRPASMVSQINDVLDETALEMTGLLRGVVLDADEIKSSKDAEDGDVFSSSGDDDR